MKFKYHQRKITHDDVLNIIGVVNLRQEIRIHNIQNYQRAFMHKSSSSSSNERDEFLGDSLIALITNLYLFERFDDQDEGFLTKMKTKIVNGKSLAAFASKLQLEQYILLSKQMSETTNERTIQAILEDTLEAFVSCMFRDQSQLHGDDGGRAFAVTRRFFTAVIEKFVDFSELVLIETNYKDLLLKYFQKMFKVPPIYKEIGRRNSDQFEIAVCHVNGSTEIARGYGNSKREAQQDAAHNTLLYLNIITQ